MAASLVQPDSHVALLMPSGLHKIVKATPNTVISLGKFGSFPANLILERPFHTTFELLDIEQGHAYSELRIVEASELHAETLAETLSDEDPQLSDSNDSKPVQDADKDKFDLVAEDGQYLIRNNRLTVDDSSRQALSMEEIELLKKSVNTGSGKDIIAKIMQSHSALDEKTAFSLAKYTLRKSKKYLKRFTLLPLDVNTLVNYVLNEQEASRILELRPELLGLIASWSNVHCSVSDSKLEAQVRGLDAVESAREDCGEQQSGIGRWLVVDDVRGLVVAALAERMGILHAPVETSSITGSKQSEFADDTKAVAGDDEYPDVPNLVSDRSNQDDKTQPRARIKALPESMSASCNTITLVHAATQPNISLLEYFDFDPHELSAHPLHSSLKTIDWFQLLHPESTPTYFEEPPRLPEQELKDMKPSKRGTYYRKRRRWQRTVRVIDETRAGGFDGLIIASLMQPENVMHHLVPLVRGGGQVVVYSPSIEPLTRLSDAYSSARKAAFLNILDAQQEPPIVPSEDFPLDPRLLLAPTLQTARAKEWQVLPGRTHPLMTGRGGSEGYIFTGTRVLPKDGKVEAKGVYTKRRKVDTADNSAVLSAS